MEIWSTNVYKKLRGQILADSQFLLDLLLYVVHLFYTTLTPAAAGLLQQQQPCCSVAVQQW